MNRAFPWLVFLVFVLSVFIDIPKHQFSFPFPESCPGICLNLGPIQVNQEIKTHLGLDLQGGTQLLLQMKLDEIPAGQSVVDYNERARRVIDRRINGLGVSEPVIQAVGDDKILMQLPGIDDIQKANDLATQQANLPTDFLLVLVALILIFMTVIEYLGRRRALGTSYLTPGLERALRLSRRRRQTSE